MSVRVARVVSGQVEWAVLGQVEWAVHLQVEWAELAWVVRAVLGQEGWAALARSVQPVLSRWLTLVKLVRPGLLWRGGWPDPQVW